MEFQALAALFLVAAVNAALPGPCVISIVGCTLRNGRWSGACLCAGIFLDDMILIAVAIGSVAGVIALSPQWFDALKWGGVAVLLGLAALSLPPGGKGQLSSAARTGGRSLPGSPSEPAARTT
jgi:threonine/homoserine/homoserine lactone efflux protein